MVLMERWDPFAEMRRMENMFNRRWRNFFPAMPNGEVEGWAIPLDVVEDGDNIVVHASLPGVKPEELNVTVEDNILTIRAEAHAEAERQEGQYLMRERRSGAWHRALRLPETVDTDKAATHYEHGVLTITFPKAASKKARQLPVTSADSGQLLEGEKS